MTKGGYLPQPFVPSVESVGDTGLKNNVGSVRKG